MTVEAVVPAAASSERRTQRPISLREQSKELVILLSLSNSVDFVRDAQPLLSLRLECVLSLCCSRHGVVRSLDALRTARPVCPLKLDVPPPHDGSRPGGKRSEEERRGEQRRGEERRGEEVRGGERLEDESWGRREREKNRCYEVKLAHLRRALSVGRYPVLLESSICVSPCLFFLNDDDDDDDDDDDNDDIASWPTRPLLFFFRFFFPFFLDFRRGGSVRVELEYSMPSGIVGRGKDGIEDETIGRLVPARARKEAA